MSLSLQDRWLQGFRDPDAAQRWLRGLALPRGAILWGLVVMVIGDVMLSAMAEILLRDDGRAALEALQPFRQFAMLNILVLLMVSAITVIGRFMDGQGQFDDVMLTMVWTQSLLLSLQVVQLLVLLLVPGVALGLLMAIVFYGFWLSCRYVQAVHGFDGFARALAVVLLSTVAVAFVLVSAMAFLNIPPQGALG